MELSRRCGLVVKLITGGVIVGLFSLFFGAKEVETVRPDFTNVINKAVHFGNGVSLSYEIPGNLSSLMDFGQGYMKDSPRTFDVSLDDRQGFSQDRWRMAKSIDGAMWSYLGDKKRGLGGELGGLNFDLSLNQYQGDSLESHIFQSYETYLNGPNGSNTEIRESEMADGASDEELGNWIAYAPSKVERREIAGAAFLYWPQSNEQRGYEFIYYVLPLNEKFFVSFRFQYSANANDDQEYAENISMIREDIDTFMQRVVVSHSR